MPSSGMVIILAQPAVLSSILQVLIGLLLLLLLAIINRDSIDAA